MRIPDPKANTTTEAYLAYKAGYLEQSELKPVLYEPYLHFDGWLAYWAGLVPMYPIKAPGKNLFNKNDIAIGWNWGGAVNSICYPYSGQQSTRALYLLPVEPNTKYTVSLASSDWYVMEIDNVDSNFTILSKSKTTQENAFTQTITTGEHYAFLGFKFKYGSAGTTTITEEMLSELKLQVELGDTATSYEDYTGEPEMLCDEEALVAYLSGVTDTYPQEIKDPYDVRIVGYLKHLVSARWPEPDYPVNNEEFYLSTMKPPVVPSGDTPSSDIEMDDTAEAPFIDLKMYGDTSQNAYTGKNIIDFTTISYSGANNGSGTRDGATFTVTGVSDGNWGGIQFVQSNLQLKTDTTYTFSATVVSTTSTNGSMVYANSAMSNTGSQIYGNYAKAGERTVVTFTTPSSITNSASIRLYPAIADGIAVFTDIMVEESSTATSYEPYTGGIPAPNPDYPQDIDVVTGRQVVGVRGKNLFYGSNNTSGGIVSAWEGSKVTLEGITTSSYANITGIDPIPTVFEAGTYTFSTDTVTNEYSKVIRIREDGENHDYTIPKGDRSITFTTSGSFTVRICFISGFSQNVGISDTFGLQLELGSEPTAYSPYGGANYEINLGKNLFDNSLSPVYSTGATSEPLSTGIRINTTETQGNCFCGFRLFKSSDFVGKTITLSANITASASNQPNAYIGICAENGSSRVAKVFMTGTGEKSVSYTHTEEDASRPYIMVALYSNYAGGTPQVGTYADFNNLQLEVGSTATPYSPYFEPMKLYKIGDHQDCIYRDVDGDWYVHKETGKIVLDGSENWLRNDTNEVFTLADAVSYSVDGTAPYSNYFKGQADVSSYARMENNSIGLLMSSSNNRTVIKYSSETSASGFKTWLSTHNTIVYYPLATATDTKITNSELISQLDALMEGGSYEGKTYIKVTATDPNLPGLLYVEAGKYD